MQSTLEPGAAVSQISNAPASVAPPEMPVRIPSLYASSCDSRIASLLLTGTIRSISPAATASWVSFGMKSGAQPCTMCGRKLGWLSVSHSGCGISLPSSGELSGSHTTTLVCGLSCFSTRATPFSVPPVPKPVTQ